MATTINNTQQNVLRVLNTQTLVNMAVVINGVQKMETEMAKVTTKVETFKKRLEDSGLGTLDISAVFKGGGLAAPFVAGVQAAIEEENKLTTARKQAESTGAKERALGNTAQNLANLDDALDSVSVKFGQALLPAVNTVVTALVPLVNRVAEFVAANPNLVQGLAAGALAFTALRGAVTGVMAAMELAKVAMLASPIGLVALGIAAAAALIVAYWEPISGFFGRLWEGIKSAAATVMSILPKVLAWSPMPLLTAGWGAISDFFTGLWDSLKGPATTVVDFFETLFSWSPLGIVIANWEPLTGLFDSIWRLLKALAVPVRDFLKTLFDWSPLGMVVNNWGPISGFFDGLWTALVAAVAPVPGVLKTLFDWSPIGLIIANWQPLTEAFATLWNVLRSLAEPVVAFLQGMFEWSPLGLIIKNWEPIVGWFGELWNRLQNFIAPIRELFSGGFGGFIAQVTGEVDSLAQQQEVRNAQAGSGLIQSSGSLIQQAATNNRTQLEGGLTVRFENAPQGLRVDQPQTNQPGLSLTPAVGYRSLSFGGAYGD
ncbi:phage tail protein [Pseudomonas asplenii]|uniref:phage tail protein n=1 Tax=Pseudomonas asplenii TaxID=53407 RepID=UPI002361BE34|nr:phage tail protein [Pseudomonas asplenii]